jgi:hypothetical protein
MPCNNLASPPRAAQIGAVRAHARMGSDMKTAAAILIVAAAVLSAPAHGAALIVVKVSAPQVNCVFNATCTITVDDTTGTFKDTLYGAGPFLQSRTYPGQPGTPAANMTGYQYRLDLTSAPKLVSECVAGVTIDIGPVAKLTYPPNQPGHVFVITQGGLGNVGVRSAVQDGDVITFWFDGFLCAGQTSYFFGLAAGTKPIAGTAVIFGPGKPGFIQTAARMPEHRLPPKSRLMIESPGLPAGR